MTEDELMAAYRNSRTLPLDVGQAATYSRPNRPVDSSRAPAGMSRGLAGDPVTISPAVGPARPIRLVLRVATADDGGAWLLWLARTGWRVHRVGAAVYAHRPGAPGWIVGITSAGRTPPAWLPRVERPGFDGRPGRSRGLEHELEASAAAPGLRVEPGDLRVSSSRPRP